MDNIFNIQTLNNNNFNQDFNNLYDLLLMNQNTPGKNALLIQDFISTYDQHKGFTLVNKVNKTNGVIKQRKVYFANEFNGYKIDNYLPIIKNKKTNTFNFYKGESLDLLKCRLQNALIVKAYILESINEFNAETYLIESLKLYNRIHHKECNVTPSMFIEYVKFAANNHDELTCKNIADFKNRTYVKKLKYEWKTEDFNSLVDGLTLELNYEMWLKTDFSYIKLHNDNVKDVSYRTFQRILKLLNIKKKYATRTTKELNTTPKISDKPGLGLVDSSLFTSLDEPVSINVCTKGMFALKSIDINKTYRNDFDSMMIENSNKIFNYK